MVTIKSALLPVPVGAPTADAFMRAAARTYAKKLLFKSARYRQTRTPATVQANYDRHAAAYMTKLMSDQFSWDDYVYGEALPEDFYIYDMQIRFGPDSVSRRKIADLLIQQVSALAGSGPSTIVEFGCGTGRNVALLKRHLPHLNVVGLELSSQSVTAARAAAEKFGLDVTFHQADVSAAVPELPGDVSVVYSVHALEMMPRIFKNALENMVRAAGRAVLLLEPICECYPWDLRHAFARFRAVEMDRLRGLAPYVRQRQWRVRESRLLPWSSNPLNPTVLMVLEK